MSTPETEDPTATWSFETKQIHAGQTPDSVLNAGKEQSEAVTFTPTDTTDFTPASGTVTVNVAQATPTVGSVNAVNIIFGTPLANSQLSGTVNFTVDGNLVAVPGMFTYSSAAGSQLNIRYQAPSCWDGIHLDTPDHKSHMAYPVIGVCPADHPVAVPMLEFKMAFPVSGNMSAVRLSSGRAYSFHYDFYNAWDAPTLAALVTHCIVGGLQCDPRGFDLYKPDRGAALNENYELP